MLRALIIDPEGSARDDLKAKLAAHPDVALAGESATLAGARELLTRCEHDVVFLDLPFEPELAFEVAAEAQRSAEVVFVTAHAQHACRAFEVGGVDYLLKPIAVARLKAAVTRVVRRLLLPGMVERAVGTALQLQDGVYLHNGRHARLSDVAHISAIRADDNYSEVLLSDGARILMRKSLSSWVTVLPPSHFMRVHRTCIVNLARVVRYERDADEHTRLYVEGSVEPLPGSRTRWSELRTRLRALKRPL